jgi:simple sugar transport system permease protein
VSSPGTGAPAWVGHVALPIANLAAALVVSGLLIALLGADPFHALKLLVAGAFGGSEVIGYTLYYATSFIFTGLAVAIAFHAGLFNIGAEGQAYIGGLGVGLLALAGDGLPALVLLPLSIAVSAAFGAGWAYGPAWLQARRGSHIVITTIMFNFIASALMTYLLVNVLIKPGQQSPETREFAASAWLPFVHDFAGWLGIELGRSPLNLSFVWALLCCAAFWFYVWHTRWGYRLRALGLNEDAAIYGGVSPQRTIILAMTISGALAGFVALNEILGFQHRLLLNFTGGAGFVGIAVALMGRNHPVGIVLAALLFGALYQGGSEVSFELPNLNRDMIVAIQGFIILMCGAFENLFRRRLEALFSPRAAV